MSNRHLKFAWAWWGQAIALAIDGDEDSRAQLSDATGVPDAHEVFAKIGDEGADPAYVWFETLTRFASDPDKVDATRPARGEPGWDEVLAPAAEYCMRIIRGALAGNPACLPR